MEQPAGAAPVAQPHFVHMVGEIMNKWLLAGAVSGVTVNVALAQAPSTDEMWEIIQQQQEQIERQQ